MSMQLQKHHNLTNVLTKSSTSIQLKFRQADPNSTTCATLKPDYGGMHMLIVRIHF